MPPRVQCQTQRVYIVSISRRRLVFYAFRIAARVDIYMFIRSRKSCASFMCVRVCLQGLFSASAQWWERRLCSHTLHTRTHFGEHGRCFFYVPNRKQVYISIDLFSSLYFNTKRLYIASLVLSHSTFRFRVSSYHYDVITL